MKKIITVLVMVAAVLPNTACSLEDDAQNFHFVTLRVQSAEVPESFQLNQVYDIPFVFQRDNGCVFYEGMADLDTDLTEREFYPQGRQLTGDIACTTAVEDIDASFRFQVLYSEPYVFKFYAGVDDQGNATFIEYTIPVESGSTNAQN